MVQEKIGHEVMNVTRTHNFIGHSQWCNADPDFKGTLDEVYVYNRDLSPTEIQELMSGGCAATYNVTTGTIHVPCFNLANTTFWLDLSVYSGIPPFLLKIDDYGIK
jgi:hypothetical protein